MTKTKRSRRRRLIAIGVVVAAFGTLLTGGLITAANDEQTKVAAYISLDKRAGKAGAAAITTDEATFQGSGASTVVDDPYFHSASWQRFVTDQTRADTNRLNLIKSAARKDAASYLFPGPRNELLAYTAKVQLSIPTKLRLTLYAEKVAQTLATGGEQAAQTLALQMFSDKTVADAVVAAAVRAHKPS